MRHAACKLTLEALSDGDAGNVDRVPLLEHLRHLQLLAGGVGGDLGGVLELRVVKRRKERGACVGLGFRRARRESRCMRRPATQQAQPAPLL